MNASDRLFIAHDFDRANHRRDDAAWLGAALRGDARLVPVWGDQNLFSRDTESVVAFPAASALEVDASDAVFLGVRSDGTPYFALPVAASDEAGALACVGLDERRARFADLRKMNSLLPAGDLGLLAYARALVYWNAKTGFCNVCGSATRSVAAGHVRECTNPADGTRHFPRTDPAAIMLVYDADRCLLGRQASWSPGRYSALAGFVEPGESLEDAVVREVREESGIEIADVRYFASQPWPFPRSLMLGFFAHAVSHAIVRGDELEDVRWFSRSDVADLERAASVSLPGVDTIARRLIGAWSRGEHELESAAK